MRILDIPSARVKKLSETLHENLGQPTEPKLETVIFDLPRTEKYQLFWLGSQTQISDLECFKNEKIYYNSIRSIFKSEYEKTDHILEQQKQVLTFTLSGVFLAYLDLEDFRSVVKFLYTHSTEPDVTIREINKSVVDIVKFFISSKEEPIEKLISMIRFIGIPPEGFEELAKYFINKFPNQKGAITKISELPISTCQNYPDYIPEMVEKLDYDQIIPILKNWIDHSTLNMVTKHVIKKFVHEWESTKYNSNEEFFQAQRTKRKRYRINTIPISHEPFVKPYITQLKACTVHASGLPGNIPTELLPGYLERLAYPVLSKEDDLEVKFLGGSQIGTMGILISTSKSNILLDFGLSVANYQIPYWDEALPNLDAIFLTHAHLDHSGAIPYLFSQGYSGYVFGSAMTKELTSFLLLDSQKLMHQNFSQSVQNSDFRFKALSQESYVYQMMERFIPIKSGKEYQITPDILIKPFNAHHIQGSLAYQLESNGKKVLFTGDINFDPCALFREKIPDIPMNSDLTIVDSTYFNQPEVDSTARDKLLFQTINESNRVVIPAFSVGRAQEILLKLENEGITKNHKVSLLGMASKVARISGIKTKAHLSDRFNQPFDNEVVIAGGGMLNGGFARKLVEETKTDPETAVILCGYLAKNTLAYRLLHKMEPSYKQKVVYARFSAHSSSATLDKFYSSLKGKKALVHLGELTKDPFTRSREKKIEEFDLGSMKIPHLGSKIII